jgi:hypothetical protein
MLLIYVYIINLKSYALYHALHDNLAKLVFKSSNICVAKYYNFIYFKMQALGIETEDDINTLSNYFLSQRGDGQKVSTGTGPPQVSMENRRH